MKNGRLLSLAILPVAALAAAAIAAVLTLPEEASAGSSASGAKPPITECFASTHRKSLDWRPILAGLDLTGEQKRALQQRLPNYWHWGEHVTGPFVPPDSVVPGLEGLGLTAEQLQVIQSRIKAQVAKMNLDKPVGWPCEPFRNPSRVIAFVRDMLVYNGFPPNAAFRRANPRQIVFQAIRDGIVYNGAIVKSARRQIAFEISEQPTIGHSTVGGVPKKVAVPFDA